MKKRKRKKRITHRTQKAANFVYFTNSFFSFFILELCNATSEQKHQEIALELPLTDAFLVQPQSNVLRHIDMLCDWSRKLVTTSTNQMLLGYSRFPASVPASVSSDGFHYYVHLFPIVRFS